MQTFILKVTGQEFTEKDIREYIWQCSDLSREQISVEEKISN